MSTNTFKNPFSTGPRALMISSNLIYSLGAFFFDWNETHVKNPLWPPHARFHNGQTMSIGVILTFIVLYILSRPPSPSFSAAGAGAQGVASLALALEREKVFTAALVGSAYCVAGLSAIWYPGSDWRDPGQVDPPYRIQLLIFGGQLVLNWWGYFLEVGSLDRKGKSGEGRGKRRS